MKIVISQNISYFDPLKLRQIEGVETSLINWVTSMGLLPIPVSNFLEENFLVKWLETIEPDKFILSGGNDIGLFTARENTEKMILSFAIKNKIPVLGICRGMQFIAKNFDCELLPIIDHVNVQHEVMGYFQGTVNSYHKVGLRDCPKGFKILAESTDGSIEAFRHNKHPILGLMWHPERGDCKLSPTGSEIEAFLR